MTSEQKKDGGEVKKKVSREGQSDRGVSRDSKKKGFGWSDTWPEGPTEEAGGQGRVRGTGGGAATRLKPQDGAATDQNKDAIIKSRAGFKKQK